MNEDKLICKLCNRKYSRLTDLSRHIRKYHIISTKEYYDKYLKKENEGICLECKKETKFFGLRGYTQYCSNKCAQNSQLIQEKIKQICLEKYGVEHPSQTKEFQEKIKQTCLKKYGVENPNQSIEIKEKKKQTYLKNYGVKNPNQSIEIKEKKKYASQKHYNTNHPSQSKEIQEKTKQTNLERYGVTCPLQQIEVKEKTKQNRIKNHVKIQEKRKQTCLKKYGVEYSTQSKQMKEKSKQTCLNKYGVEHASQSEQFKNKYKQTCLDKYGVNHWLKTEEGKQICRIRAIKWTETQQLYNEPLCPHIGDTERNFLNIFQIYVSYKIIRNDHNIALVIGRFPDGHISELNLFIQFDEQAHFIDKEQKIHKEIDNKVTLQLASLGYIIWRVSELEWKNNRKKTIEQFKFLVKELTEIYEK